jgi:acylphosphatase
MGDEVRQRLHVHIRGLVQGVGFRYATYRKANELGLTGWVRNAPDGRVEAQFEGNKAQLDAMLAWCHEGPYLAGVEHVDAAWEPGPPQFHAFEIRL